MKIVKRYIKNNDTEYYKICEFFDLDGKFYAFNPIKFNSFIAAVLWQRLEDLNTVKRIETINLFEKFLK